MLLVIDNYDSFTYNLVQYFGQLGVEQVGNRQVEHRVTQEFQALVVVGAETAVRDRARNNNNPSEYEVRTNGHDNN